MINKNYSIEDLVNNPSFRRLIKGTASAEESGYWDNWLEESDLNKVKAKKAISEITGFEFRTHSAPDIKQQWNKLYSRISGKKVQAYNRGRRVKQRYQWVVRVAAILLISSLVGFGVYKFTLGVDELTHLEQLTEEHTVFTESGEQKTLTFSNGARVVLNSNSRLTYSLGLLRNQTINVTLEGEAWFDVENDSSSEPAFAVRTPDGVIRDIGTKFLVSVQQGKTRVVLQEGIVEVEQLPELHSDNNRENEVFRIAEGEMVEFNRADVITREHVNPTFYSAWATQFMQFDQTDLLDFSDYIIQHFGVDVQIRDLNVKDITLDGAVYFRSLDELIRSVSEVTGIPMYRSGSDGTIYIGANNK